MSILRDALNFAKNTAETVKDKIEESHILDKASEVGGNLSDSIKENAIKARDKAMETGEAVVFAVQAHKPDLDSITQTGKEKLKELQDKLKHNFDK